MRLRVHHSEPRHDAIANVRAAVRLRDEGKSYEQVGKELGITGLAANKLVRPWTDWVDDGAIVVERPLQLYKRHPCAEPQSRALHRVRAAVDLFDRGLTHKEIGAVLGLSPSRVLRIVERWGQWVRERRLNIAA
jgi:hypothetical protein